MYKIKITTASSIETKCLGEVIGKYACIPSSFTLEGDLGAGKTTLTKGIAVGLGITKVVNSPTFNICKIYHGTKKLVHIDAYRLTKDSDELGFEEEMDDALTIIEWACNSDMELINQSSIHISVLNETTRLIEIELNSCQQDLLKELQQWSN